MADLLSLHTVLLGGGAAAVGAMIGARLVGRSARRRLEAQFLAAGALVSCLVLLPLGCVTPPEPEAPEDGPRLLLVVIVDQFRGDYLERFDELWSGGVRRLLEEGVVFSDAHHRHAATYTATGHATLSTGVHPRRHGIISNYWADPEEGRQIYSVEDEEHDSSPDNLLASTLGDWLKQRSPRSRVFAASAKDRSAVLLAGHEADAAFWYDNDDGEWQSSDYYPRASPEWLAELNREHLPDEQFGRAWEPLPMDPEQLQAMGVEAFDLGPLRTAFPYTYGGLAVEPGESFYRGLWGKPWLDEYLTRFAERLILEEDLGGDGWTDLLALSYSSLDSVGHSYGPDSPEVLDTLLRFDRQLGRLLEVVDQRIGLDRVVVALSSDHGVAPMPELGRSGGDRLSSEGILCFQQINRRLAERFGEARWLFNGPFLNPEAIAERGVDRRLVEDEAVRLIESCPGVGRVWRRSELLEEGVDGAELTANSFHPERSPDLVVEFEEFFQPTRSAATHGSPHRYDTHVPLLFRVPGAAPRRDDEPAATVDLAPTLASLAGLAPPDVDGVDLGPRLGAAR